MQTIPVKYTDRIHGFQGRFVEVTGTTVKVTDKSGNPLVHRALRRISFAIPSPPASPFCACPLHLSRPSPHMSHANALENQKLLPCFVTTSFCRASRVKNIVDRRQRRELWIIDEEDVSGNAMMRIGEGKNRESVAAAMRGSW